MSFLSTPAEEHKGGVLLFTVSRPDKLNALNRVVMDELEVCFRGARDTDDVRAVVLTGAGTRALFAGAAALGSLDYGDRPLADGLEQEASLFGSVLVTEDAHGDVTACLENGKAEFKGR